MANKRKPDTQKKQENHHVLYRQSRLFRRGHQGEDFSIHQAQPRHGDLISDKEVQEIMQQLLELSLKA